MDVYLSFVLYLEFRRNKLTIFFSFRFSGSPPLTGSGIVRIVVLDVNDHSPEFSRQEYKASVTENSPPGTWVANPVATDRDEGLNAKIRYIHLVISNILVFTNIEF